MSIDEKNFSEYMEESLYGEKGFYTLGGGAGRERDYVTSPEVGDLFGYVVAGYIDQWCDSLDDPSSATIIEAGCGPGSLAASIARAGLRNAELIHYQLVDISPVHRETAQQKMDRANPTFTFTVSETIKESEGPTLVIANELFDNLVFDIGRTHDIYKQFEPDSLEDLSPDAVFLGRFRTIDSLGAGNVPRDIADFRVPVHVGIGEWLSDLLEATSAVGDLSILIFDYMKSIVDMDDEQWLRLFSNNRRIIGVDNVLAALEQGQSGDITTDVIKEDVNVMFDRAAFSNIRMFRQAEWLIENGIDQYAAIGPQQDHIDAYSQVQSFVMSENAERDTSSGFNNERNILLDDEGLGAFTVLQARRQI